MEKEKEREREIGEKCKKVRKERRKDRARRTRPELALQLSLYALFRFDVAGFSAYRARCYAEV